LAQATLECKGKATGATTPEVPAIHETTKTVEIIKAAKPTSAHLRGWAGPFRLLLTAVKAIVLVMLGEYEKAIALCRRSQQPDVPIDFVGKAMPITHPRCRNIFHGGLRNARLPN
jgi:hypothetical protein